MIERSENWWRVTSLLNVTKGVVCKVVPWQMMPRDKNGVYADIVTDAASVISRMNIGRLYEHQICGAGRDVAIRMKRLINKDRVTESELSAMPDTVIDQLWAMFIHLYSCVGGKAYHMYASIQDRADKVHVLTDCINKGIKLIIPIDHTKSIKDISKDIEKHVKPTYDVVTFNDPESGEEKVSEIPIRIGELFIIVLNKIADDGSSVAISKQQHFGVPTSSTKHDKHSHAWRNSPVRTDGESEVRIKIGYAGEELQAEVMDISNSAMTQRELYSNILLADKPSNIERIVDREKFPLGTSRPIQTVQHSLMCAGLSMQSVPDTEAVAKLKEATNTIMEKLKGAPVIANEEETLKQLVKDKA